MSVSCILQVEDDANDVFLLQRAFNQVGVKTPIQVATDGQMAIDYLSGAAPYDDRIAYPFPSLVLLDLKLPRKSGRDVLQWIRAQPGLRRLVVIVFTTAQYAGDVGLAYDLGANSFLTKPEDFSKYIDIVRLIRDWWLQLNQFASVSDAPLTAPFVAPSPLPFLPPPGPL